MALRAHCALASSKLAAQSWQLCRPDAGFWALAGNGTFKRVQSHHNYTIRMFVGLEVPVPEPGAELLDHTELCPRAALVANRAVASMLKGFSVHEGVWGLSGRFLGNMLASPLVF